MSAVTTAPAAPAPPTTQAEYAASLNTPARRRLIAELRALMPAPESRLTRLHRAGCLLRALRPNPVYRTKWVDVLAKRVGCDRSLLYKLVRFAERFTAEQVEELEASGACWSHVDLVLKLDVAKAIRWSARAGEREWSVRDLRVRLRRKNLLPAPGQPRSPATPQADGLELDMMQVLEPADELIRHFLTTWDESLETLRDRSLTAASAEPRGRAAYAAIRLRILQVVAGAMASRLEVIASPG